MQIASSLPRCIAQCGTSYAQMKTAKYQTDIRRPRKKKVCFMHSALGRLEAPVPQYELFSHRPPYFSDTLIAFHINKLTQTSYHSTQVNSFFAKNSALQNKHTEIVSILEHPKHLEKKRRYKLTKRFSGVASFKRPKSENNECIRISKY